MKRLMPMIFGVVILAGLFLAGCSSKEEADMSAELNSATGAELAELPTVIVCSTNANGDVTDSSFEVYEYNGKQYVFSSQACRETITSDPEAYFGDDVN